MNVTLDRVKKADGVLGILTFDDFECCTLELPWKDNVPMISCVPDGTYALDRHISPRFGECFILSNPELGVSKTPQPGIPRSLVLIHPANFIMELRGCIAVGTEHRNTEARTMLMKSRATMSKLLELLDDNNTLEIVWRC